MSIATALLLVGALGILILMHSVGHGASQSTREDVRADKPGGGGDMKSRPSRREAWHE